MRSAWQKTAVQHSGRAVKTLLDGSPAAGLRAFSVVFIRAAARA
jgi:hypothetical protein